MTLDSKMSKYGLQGRRDTGWQGQHRQNPEAQGRGSSQHKGSSAREGPGTQRAHVVCGLGCHVQDLGLYFESKGGVFKGWE